MKRLTCEMCGSTDLLKQDGVFVCQTCGTKYSVEEAKKMMIEGTVDVSGSTVKIDNTAQIKNYLEIALNAYHADNLSEAEAYCNRILEIDPQYFEAWKLKGKAIGWQSTMANSRLFESAQCFSKAIECAPENNKNAVHAELSEELSSLGYTLVKLAIDFFVKKYNLSSTPSIRDVYTPIEESAKSTEKAVQLLLDEQAKSAYYHSVATLMNNTAVKIYNDNQGLLKLANDAYSPNYRSQYLQLYMKYMTTVESLIRFAINFAKEDYESNIDRYENLLIVAKSKPYQWGEDVSKLQCEINEYRIKVKKKEEQRKQKEKVERQKRIDAYWAEHNEEKQELESELRALQVRLRQLKEQAAPYEQEIAAWEKKRESETPAQEEKKKLEEQISNLKTEKNNLGIFKGKEKKALQAQIDELSSRLPAINESIENEEKEQIKLCNDKISEIEQQAKPIKDQIAAAEKRISEIKAELTKER